MLAASLLFLLGAACSGAEEDAQCEPYSSSSDLPATQATEGPDDPFNGEPQWYIASVDGGLWITSIGPPGGGTESGIILPLNDQARVESDYGIDVAPGAPALEGADAGSPAAQRAIECAAGRP